MPVFNLFYPVKGQIDPRLMRARGPVINVEISIPRALRAELKAKKKKVPKSAIGDILIDTGASRTCVDTVVLQTMGINPIGTTIVSTPNGSSDQSLFPATIGFPDTPLPTVEFSSVIRS